MLPLKYGGAILKNNQKRFMETKPKTTRNTAKAKNSFYIGNFLVEKGKTYEVIGKKDPDAPEAFKKFNTSKYLIPGIGEHRSINFDNDKRMWDTGFYADSKVNGKISGSSSDRTETVNLFNKLVKEPYEKKYRVSLEPTSENDFFDNYTYHLYKGRIFNTEDEQDMLDLYFALQNGRVCAVDEKNPTFKNDARYCVKNREREITMAQERAEMKMESLAAFSNLLKLDPKTDDRLFTILSWLNLPDLRDSDSDAIKKTVLMHFEDPRLGVDFSERFLKVYEDSQTEVGARKLEYFTMAQELFRARVIEFKKQEYFLNGKRIGASMKEVAESCTLNPQNGKVLEEAYQEFKN